MTGLGRFFYPCGYETWLVFERCPLCMRPMPSLPWKLSRSDWNVLKALKIDPEEPQPVYSRP